MNDQELQSIRDGFDRRVAEAFQAERGRPLVRAAKHPPLAPGRGNHVRGYSWSIMDFAARCLVLDDQIEQANAALAENARHYLGNPPDINDRDSFHWHCDMACRLIEMYGAKGLVAPGRLKPDVERLMLEPMWLYVDRCVPLAEAEAAVSQTWHIHESDNHHTMHFLAAWHFAKLAKDRPEYLGRKFADGSTVGEHHAAWNEYLKAYCRQRAGKGLDVEIGSDSYNVVKFKGFYNVYDFADDPEVRRRAGLLLDLHWALWAQEQIDGVRGGGKCRIYQTGGDRIGTTGMHSLAWYFFGLGKPSAARCPLLSAMMSTYRPPLVVVDLVHDVAGRGRYEILHRPMGLAESGYYTNPDYRLKKDGGGIVCYAWCTSDFILGTPMVEPRPAEDWTLINSQNRWHGVILAGHRDARIVPQAKANDERVAFNAQWSVQRKGTLICQKLKTHRQATDMRVWFSYGGLTDCRQEDGWVFVRARGAFAAVRVVSGGADWERPSQESDTGSAPLPAFPADPASVPVAAEGGGRTRPQGVWLKCRDEWSPVILEVACAGDFPDYAAFRKAVAALAVSFHDRVLTYTGLAGDRFTFFADQSRVPQVNGQDVDYSPPIVYESPFVRGAWDGGVVTIQKAGRKLVLDFSSGT